MKLRLTTYVLAAALLLTYSGTSFAGGDSVPFGVSHPHVGGTHYGSIYVGGPEFADGYIEAQFNKAVLGPLAGNPVVNDDDADGYIEAQFNKAVLGPLAGNPVVNDDDGTHAGQKTTDRPQVDPKVVFNGN